MSYLALREDKAMLDGERGKIDAMPRLEALTNLVADLGAMTAINKGNFAEYDVEGGVAVGCGVLKKPEIAVQDMVFSAGTIFPEHSHEEKEILVCYSGRIKGLLSGEEITLDAPGHLIVEPGEPHEFEFLTKARVLAITVPSSKDYPDDQTGL